MKIWIISLIIFSCFFIDSFAKDLPDSTLVFPKFRNISWNTSIEVVKEKESAYYLQEFSGFGIVTLSYKDKIAGVEARVDYTFKNDRLIEGTYIIKPGDSFKKIFVLLSEYLRKEIGKPDYRSGPLYSSDTLWIKENDYGRFSGPSFYWVFIDGFISLLSQKFEDDITVTVLYAHGSSIENYAKNNGVELSKFPYKVMEK